jgi:hypothetical protein
VLPPHCKGLSGQKNGRAGAEPLLLPFFIVSDPAAAEGSQDRFMDWFMDRFMDWFMDRFTDVNKVYELRTGR